MGECLRLLEDSPMILDRRLTALVKLQRIVEETSLSFGFNDESTARNLSEDHTQVIIKSFERRMEEWKAFHSPHIIDVKVFYNMAGTVSMTNAFCSVSLTISYYRLLITFYEFAMDGGHHDVESLKHKYWALPIPEDDESVPLKPLSTTQVNATMKCISSSQTLLDTFLQMGTDTLRNSPNVNSFTLVYAIVVLLKTSSRVSMTDLGRLIDSRCLKVNQYTN